MALNGLSVVFGGGKDFIPHIEERAIRYTMRNYVMSQRVYQLSDMTGWNDRKVTEYLRGRRAQTLAEDTAIPDTVLVRARKASIAPHEVGDKYRISDRREDTDLENIVSDTIEALGRAVGDRREVDFFKAALAGFRGGNLGSTSTVYTTTLPIDGQFEFRKLARKGQLFHVVHPFQARTVMKDLVTYAGAQTDLDFRNSAIASWTLPGFEGLNIAVSDFIPRKIVNNVPVYGTGGTFRLALNSGHTVGEDITAAITVSATPATTVANIKAALEALTFTGNGTWTVAGATNLLITVTPPATLYLDGDSELRVAVDQANPTVINAKSAYDLVTGLSGAPLDKDGASLGVQVTEKSASCKSLLFYRNALVWDVRKPLQAYFSLPTEFSGRTAEYSAYETYGIGEWQGELGMTIETAASSAFATG